VAIGSKFKEGVKEMFEGTERRKTMSMSERLKITDWCRQKTQEAQRGGRSLKMVKMKILLIKF
jgi:hypothetical protein